jgi:hypothetical protein
MERHTTLKNFSAPEKWPMVEEVKKAKNNG